MRNVDGDDHRAPQPGLTALPELVAGVEGAGIAVDLRVDGAPRTLPAGINLAVYRIVQESVTNALRHAGATCIGILLDWRADALWIEVSDDGSGAAGEDTDGQD